MSPRSVCSILLLSSLAFAPVLSQTQKPLTQTQLRQLVEAGVDNERVAKTIEQRGIDFELSGQFLTLLREKAALPVLLKALGANALKTGQAPLDKDLLRELVAAGVGGLSLAKAVWDRGINFPPAADYLQSLHDAGALEALLNALRESAPKPLTREQVLNLLASGVSADRVATLVKKRGLTFKPNEEYLDNLRIAGADDVVVGAVRGARHPPDFLLLCKLGASGRGIHPLAFSPDGRLLAGAAGESAVKLWNVTDGREVRTVGAHSDLIRTLAISPNGVFLASAGYDSMTKIWEVQTGREPRILQGHKGDVNAVTFSPDGSCLASAGQDGTVRLWDFEKGVSIRTLASGDWAVRALAFSPDGKRLAAGRYDKTIIIWDVPTGNEAATLTGPEGYAVNDVAFNPDGTLLASAVDDYTIKLWDVVTGREVRSFEGHKMVVLCVRFTRDGRYLASGSADGSLRLWEVETGQEVSRLLEPGLGTVPTMALSADGKYLAAAQNDTILIWRVED